MAPPLSRGLVALIPGLAVFMGVSLWLWKHELESRGALLTAEIEGLKSEWVKVSDRLSEAQRMQPRYEAFLGQARGIAQEDEGATWTPVLRILAAPAGAGIALRGVAIREAAEGSRTWILRVQGDAAGSVPRLQADGYRQALQARLSQEFQVIEPCRFDRLEDEGLPAAPAPPRTEFTISAKLMLKAAEPAGDIH